MGGREVERVPMVSVPEMASGWTDLREAGMGIVEVADGNGESKEPCMLSMLEYGYV
jgi:hypothetical protein